MLSCISSANPLSELFMLEQPQSMLECSQTRSQRIFRRIRKHLQRRCTNQIQNEAQSRFRCHNGVAHASKAVNYSCHADGGTVAKHDQGSALTAPRTQEVATKHQVCQVPLLISARKVEHAWSDLQSRRCLARLQVCVRLFAEWLSNLQADCMEASRRQL